MKRFQPPEHCVGDYHKSTILFCFQSNTVIISEVVFDSVSHRFVIVPIAK